MNPTPQDLKAIAEIPKLPVNISTDGLTAFMLIAQLQLALRHPGNTGETADRVKKIVIDLQNQLCGRTHLEQDDFWCEEWGELPPVFERNDYDLMDFEL